MNTKTGHISPQFHVIFDDNFTSLSVHETTKQIKIWDGLSMSHTWRADTSSALLIDEDTWKPQNASKNPISNLHSSVCSLTMTSEEKGTKWDLANNNNKNSAHYTGQIIDDQTQKSKTEGEFSRSNPSEVYPWKTPDSYEEPTTIGLSLTYNRQSKRDIYQLFTNQSKSDINNTNNVNTILINKQNKSTISITNMEKHYSCIATTDDSIPLDILIS